MKIRVKKVLQIVLITTPIVLLFVFLGIIWYTGTQVVNGFTNWTTNEQTALNRETLLPKVLDDVEDFQSKYTVEQISIPSSIEDHTIPADYISENGNKNHDTVILIHGLGANRLYTYAVAEMFLEMGYNTIAYDQRSTGENFAEHNTYGYYESYDLLDYVDYADSFMDEDKQLVVWGSSYGGATAGIALGRNPDKIDRVILDCPLSEAKVMIEYSLTSISIKTGLPVDFMMFAGSLVSKIKFGFTIDDLTVSEWILDTPVPVLIINSAADRITPFFMGENIYNAIRNESKEIVTVYNSAHANVFNDHPELYKKEVSDFLR